MTAKAEAEERRQQVFSNQSFPVTTAPGGKQDSTTAALAASPMSPRSSIAPTRSTITGLATGCIPEDAAVESSMASSIATFAAGDSSIGAFAATPSMSSPSSIAPTGSTITRLMQRAVLVAEEAEAAGVDSDGPSVASSLPVTPITLVFKDLHYFVPNPRYNKAAVKKATKALAAGTWGCAAAGGGTMAARKALWAGCLVQVPGLSCCRWHQR